MASSQVCHVGNNLLRLLKESLVKTSNLSPLPFRLMTAALLCTPALFACGDDGGGGGGDDGGSSAGRACAESAGDQPQCASWIINTTERSAVLQGSDGQGILTDVQSAEVVSEGGADYIQVNATGIPSYRFTLTQEMFDELTSRPNASTDYRTGAPTVSVGDTIDFGADVGLNSNSSCTEGAGFGFWPPGPVCPEDVGHEALLPLNPTPASATCYTGLGTMGLWVNGVSIYTWSDGQSYDGQGTWYNLAAVAEIYDVDLCGGHAANGDYHHHANPNCLAAVVGDDGSGHSPVYGIVADGYPIHGPWHASGTRAQSCWKARDYESASSASGCGGGGVRDCHLVDPFDLSKGTTAADNPGPNTSDVVSTLSGNMLEDSSGYYFEDYYYDPDCAAQGGEYLDEHNGHDHDGLGYHYHTTATFPFNIGPTFAGALPANGLTTCSDSPQPTLGGGGGMMPPGGGMPPGGMMP